MPKYATRYTAAPPRPAPPTPRRRYLEFIELRDRYRRAADFDLFFDHDAQQYVVRNGRHVVAELMSLQHAKTWLDELLDECGGATHPRRSHA